jgi:alpha-tubulin suppressor-like RCC1 family protein
MTMNKNHPIVFALALIITLSSACERLAEDVEESQNQGLKSESSGTKSIPQTQRPTGPIPAPSPVPQQETSFPAIFAGARQSCVVIQGAVSCWGDQGTGARLLTPTPVVGWQSGVKELGLGIFHGCAVFTDGHVECLGRNNMGQLGAVATLTTFMTPVQMPGLLHPVTKITSGSFHNCVVTSKMGVDCWGGNDYGQLGIYYPGSVMSCLMTPFSVNHLGGQVVQASAGNDFSCARLKDGTVKCWGMSLYGRLGNALLIGSNEVVQSVLGLSDKVVDLRSGGAHSCALLQNGQVQCWGDDSEGQLGRGVTPPHADQFAITPTNVVGLSSIQAIAAGMEFTCALSQIGEVSCWGNGKSGQLGNGATRASFLPVKVQNLPEPVVQISAGSQHVCGVLQSGKLVCWGDNSEGQLGDGTQIQRTLPVSVNGF